MKRLLIAAWLLFFVRVLSADELATATARFLAGLPVRDTPLESYTLQPSWADHATEFDHAWSRFAELQLNKIANWAPQFLGEPYLDTGPMFYMFSGPDFLYAHVFFPRASSYILCGIEPVGSIPDISRIPPQALGPSLANLRKSLDSVLNWSFFITKNMKVDLTQAQLSGTLPVLYVFLARAGCVIDSVTPVTLDKAGNLIENDKGKTPGVRIVFSNPDLMQQTLYYFSSNLEDDAVRSNPGFIRFCDRQGNGVSLLKAASYLMHEGGFSQVRDFLLTHSKVILQDDSGIPIQYFANDKWRIRFCGNYVGPIDTFKKFYQPDLAKAYSVSAPAPLSFSFGYRWQPSQASLIVATPKSVSISE